MGLFGKIKTGLKKTKENVVGQIDSMLKVFSKIDEDLFLELEEILISCDVGVLTAQKICGMLKDRVTSQNIKDPQKIRELLKGIVEEMLEGESGLKIQTKPSVVLVIGVNGTGKTTTIGKMALILKNEGKSVILGAADTFRAAAIDQLKFFADKAKVPLIRQEEGSDPAAVVFDTISAAKSRGCDVIICDTAGRLHNKKNLMDELSKINRVISRELPKCDVEMLLVLDATTGQNAVNQAREFKKAVGLTGIVLTKLDGTAKGGVVLCIKEELGVPVKFIGVGEQIDDLQPFDAKKFADAMFDKE